MWTQGFYSNAYESTLAIIQHNCLAEIKKATTTQKVSKHSNSSGNHNQVNGEN